jgi:hypothetical protein
VLEFAPSTIAVAAILLAFSMLELNCEAWLSCVPDFCLPHPQNPLFDDPRIDQRALDIDLCLQRFQTVKSYRLYRLSKASQKSAALTVDVTPGAKSPARSPTSVLDVHDTDFEYRSKHAAHSGDSSSSASRSSVKKPYPSKRRRSDSEDEEADVCVARAVRLFTDSTPAAARHDLNPPTSQTAFRPIGESVGSISAAAASLEGEEQSKKTNCVSLPCSQKVVPLYHNNGCPSEELDITTDQEVAHSLQWSIDRVLVSSAVPSAI